MILDEIVLHDFGIYAGRQKIALTPPDRDRSIVLFGGLNGHGKTTLLDAIQLCLYGPFAKISNRNGLAYPDYLSRCLHRGSGAREAAIEIAFRHTIDGMEERYRLHRSWRQAGGGCREHFEVLKNRRRDDALAENWINQVEDLIPPNIANLFLFDGEQVESYAAEDNSTRLIGSAIHNLLGLDIVDQLDKDLLTYSRRKRMEDKNEAARAEIEEAEAVLKRERTRIGDLKQEQASLKAAGIDRTRKRLAAIEEEYRKLGGELYERRVELERKLAGAEAVLDGGAARLREFAAGDLPLMLVRDLLRTVRDRDRDEERARRARDVGSVLEDRDEELTKLMRRHEVDSGAIETIALWLKKDRTARNNDGERETVLNLLPETRSDLTALLDGRLDELKTGIRPELEGRVEAERLVERARIEFASVPDEDALADIVERRGELRNEIAALEAQYDGIQREIGRLSGEVERREQALVRMLEADARVEEERRDRNRVLQHAGRVRTTLATFRKIVIEKHVQSIEQLVLDSYRQLLRKDSLVTRLKIDPESFDLTLFGRDGGLLNVERLSAGERQLLAIALLWGLAKASGRPLPTAIDTPLGRLDAGHRSHLVERYFPFASHQVLLLSTDEEIAGGYLDKLMPYVGRSYRLDYDDAAGHTTVVEGYFREAEAG